MVRRFFAIRNLRDVRTIVDLIVYQLKFAPAIGCTSYLLVINGRLAVGVAIVAAWIIVLGGVEIRAALQRYGQRTLSSRSQPGS